MRTGNKRTLWALTALMLSLSLLPAEAFGVEDIITISQPQELLALSEQCRVDAWSEGRTVRLTADIDLSGLSFRSIPVFRGRFEGNGHTISGLELKEKGSQVGLFRLVEAGGYIEDLTVEGVAAPGGSASAVGLLAGENAGEIHGCSVGGSVTGTEDVGGLVGINIGIIDASDGAVTVTGVKNVGGVAGRNTGVIQAAANRGEVNTAPADDSLSDPITNVGGIAGSSEGRLQGCENYAPVGYSHTGYNVGGIVGCHSGAMSECVNRGFVQGRKGVGGITGRFVPETDIVYGQDPVKTLDAALSGLSGLMLTLSGQLTETVDRGLDDVDGIADNVDAIRQTASEGRRQGTEDARAAVDKIYEDMQTINGEAGAINDAFGSLSDDAGAKLGELGDHLDEFRREVDAAADAADNGLRDGTDHLEDYARDIGDSLALARGAMDGMAGDLERVDNFTGTARKIFQSGDDPLTKLRALREAAETLKDLDLSGALRQMGAALDQIGRTASELTAQLGEDYDNASDNVRRAWRRAKEAADAMSGDGEALNELFRDFSDQVGARLETVNGRVKAMEDTLKDWGGQLDQVGTATLDEVDGYLQAIQAQVDAMTGGARQSNADIRATTDSIIRQLEQVRMAANGMTRTPEYEVDDRSDEEAGSDGLIRSARNEGAVTGDANVGGVVGIVSIQLDRDDPEADWDWDEEERGLLSSVTAVIRAAVRGCENQGAITAKNECAGGIVGRADMGAVLECLNTGDVTVESGANCGGVAGLSKSAIRRSYALCLLTGSDNVGGIVGTGSELTQCRSMVTLDAEGERLGAIAGQADGPLTENYSVAEGLGALDGIDRVGQAQGLPYGEFAALEGLPEVFSRFELTFVAEGERVKRLRFDYDGRIDPQEIPAVPAREGFYGTWESFPTDHLCRSRRVEAVYTAWETTVSSGGQRPEILIQGSFSPEATVELEQWTPTELPKGMTLVAGWHYRVVDPSAPAAGQQADLTLRVLAEAGGEKAVAALWQDGTAHLAEDSLRDGGYLILAPAGMEGHVAVLAPTGGKWIVPAAAGGILAALLAAVGVKRKRKAKAQAASAATGVK